MKSTTQKSLSLSILSFLLIISFSNSAVAQFWTEDFVPTNVSGLANGYVGANPGAWTVTTLGGNTGSLANEWYISCTESSMQPNNCGAICPPVPLPPPTPYIAQSLHLGANALIGDNGALYAETGASLTDTELRAESPTINCSGQTGITLSFNYIEFGDGTEDNAQVWYFDGVTWSMLADMPKTLCGDNVGGPCNTLVCDGFSQGYWTAFSVALPASANNNANVKIGFYWRNIDGISTPTDPSVAIGRVQLTSPATANTITAGNLIGPFCACATANLPFSSTGTFNTGNIYTAQLSDAAGSFASPVSLGTFPSTANVGNFALTIPCATPAGTGYMIQIVSSAPNVTSTAIGPFTINAALPLSVAVTATTGTAICPGDCVTFTATPTNGGSAPTFQWQVNGVNGTAPSTNATYVDCSLQVGDLVTVIATSNLACVSNSPDTSAAFGPITSNALPLSVAVTASPALAICPGECVTFTATPTNGGVAPTYQWQVNGVNGTAPSTNSTYVDCFLQAGDQVTVIVTSNLACVSNSPATSTASVISFINPQPFSVTLTTTPSPLTICTGEPIVLTASTVNGGPNPTYEWTVNGATLPGVTTQTLNYNGTPVPIVDGTEVCVIASSSLPGCVTNTPDTVCSTVTVIAGLVPSVTIAADSSTICVGGTVNFTSVITNGGTNPSYQWFIGANAVPAPQGTGSTFTTSSLVPGDVVSLEIISNSTCVTTPTASSNIVAINILPYETPTISILPNGGICPGQSITFISSHTGGGLNPLYRWYLNDTILLGGSSSLTVNSSIFQNNDTLTCIMISNYPCLLNDTATSNAYNIQLLAPAELNIGDDVSILYGESYKTDPEINGPVSLGLFLWTPDSTLNCNTCISPIATPTITTNYVLVYKNSAGCFARDTIKVEVKPNYEVFIPTGFSPNNDNINDVFYARGPYISSVNMKIWDRFGGVIFESPYLNYGWDGTKHFKEVNTGVYVYYITVEFLDGVTKEFKGNITLSR
jgi:gliding motility-associated-like protein